MDQKPHQLMTIKEVAALMRVDRSTVHRWMRLGRLPSIRVGGTTRIKYSDVMTSVERYEYGGPPKRDPAMG